MKLLVNNSSSAGNSYSLTSNDGEILLLEAGVKAKNVIKAIDYQTSKVVGCLLSHVHGDHAKYATDYSHYGIEIAANQDVFEKKNIDPTLSRILEECKTYSFGQFQVAPFNVKHDVPTLGFFIRHPECGTILFATDCVCLPYRFPSVNHFLIEANYSDEIVDSNILAGIEPYFRKQRLLQTHMSIENTISSIRSCNPNKTKTITLIHLSSLNADPIDFQRRVASAFGIPTFIAKPQLIVNYDLRP